MISTSIVEVGRTDIQLAKSIANQVMNLFGGFFLKYEICGSIRREKLDIGDIDIVAILKSGNEKSLSETIKKIDPNGQVEAKNLGRKGVKRFLDGDLIKRFKFQEMFIDLYLANESSFETLKLIRTGSIEHNIKLTTLAKQKKLKLFASGKGLCEIDDAGNIIKVIATNENEILLELLGRIPLPLERN